MEQPMLDPSTISIADPAPEGIVYLPLDQLMLSGLNVRKTERDAEISALAEDLAARGLKQNLVVIPAHFSTGDAEADWAGRFEVVAGGRRYQALALLASAERIPADHPVPCLIETREDARETSLSENLHKVSMNPADEFEAFAAIVDQQEKAGQAHDDAVAYCARRFGATVKHVEGRLRLATLAPEILQALRENTLTLDSAKAYARVADHKLQLKVFKEHAKTPWKKHNPEYIRSDLAGKTCPLDDRRVTYVTLQAYRDAGGRSDVEMFMGAENGERLLDVPLLDRLVKEKAEAAIPALAKADGFKEGLFGPGGVWPKAPKGFERAWDQYYGSKPPSKTQLKKSIAVYDLENDGTGLARIGRFKLEVKDKSPGYTPPTPEEIAAEQRKRGVDRAAAQLAVGPFAGSPFEGRSFWPKPGYIQSIENAGEGHVYVAVLVKVSAADIEAQREAAEQKYDADLAAAAEAKRTEEAATLAAGDEPDDLDAVPDQIEGDEDEGEE
jgi:ParB family chromosome partitioning protein